MPFFKFLGRRGEPVQASLELNRQDRGDVFGEEAIFDNDNRMDEPFRYFVLGDLGSSERGGQRRFAPSGIALDDDATILQRRLNEASSIAVGTYPCVSRSTSASILVLVHAGCNRPRFTPRNNAS